jgi:hypothetical protein
MAINGTHMLFYTSEPEQLRAMLRDVFGFKHVDAGGGWLIFALPPAEIGIHPSEGPNWDSGMRHEISFMCDDIHETMTELRAKGVAMDAEPKSQRYGHTVMLQLPGGCKAMLYQPLHLVAAAIAKPARKKVAKKSAAAKKPTKKEVSPPKDRRAKKAARRR